MSLSFFRPTATVEVEIAGEHPTKRITPPSADGPVDVPVFEALGIVAGSVVVHIQQGKRLEHQGVKLELIGQIELLYDRGNNTRFLSLVRELEPVGTLSETTTYPFEFTTEKPYESFSGTNVLARYFLRVTVSKQYGNSMVKEHEFIVQHVQPEPEVNPAINMEIGITDCIHLQETLSRQKYHLKDVITGNVQFLLTRIRLKYAEVAIIRRESVGQGPNAFTESENVAKFEVMDGSPSRGEVVPIRMHLATIPLTPTYRGVHNLYSVRYHFNLVLVDEDDRRYFKQAELTLWRKELG